MIHCAYYPEEETFEQVLKGPEHKVRGCGRWHVTSNDSLNKDTRQESPYELKVGEENLISVSEGTRWEGICSA